MRLPDLAAIEAAAALIHPVVPPTPQILWPLLSQRADAEVWVKHENHTLVGAFKIRGGLVYMHELKRREPGLTGVIAATRGNHGIRLGRQYDDVKGSFSEARNSQTVAPMAPDRLVAGLMHPHSIVRHDTVEIEDDQRQVLNRTDTLMSAPAMMLAYVTARPL